MRTLEQRRRAAAYVETGKTMTDQSAAATTDLHVIVNQFLKTGQSGSRSTPRYGDFSELPEDLRGYINQARALNHHRTRLPEQLRNMPTNELLALTTEQIAQILNPPAPQPPAQGAE